MGKYNWKVFYYEDDCSYLVSFEVKNASNVYIVGDKLYIDGAILGFYNGIHSVTKIEGEEERIDRLFGVKGTPIRNEYDIFVAKGIRDQEKGMLPDIDYIHPPYFIGKTGTTMRAMHDILIKEVLRANQ